MSRASQRAHGNTSTIILVPLQESERLNVLLLEMRRSLTELDLGLKGSLTMTAPMEATMAALAGDTVPACWKKCSSPSLRGLASWFANLLARHAQLQEWTSDLAVPKSVWLPGPPPHPVRRLDACGLFPRLSRA